LTATATVTLEVVIGLDYRKLYHVQQLMYMGVTMVITEPLIMDHMEVTNMYHYQAKLLRVIDGDTVDAMIDLGFDIHIKKRIRLYGINAWESRTRDLDVKTKGLAAKVRLRELLEQSNNEFTVISHGHGKFGRCLGELVTKHGNINKILVTEGHAVVYT